MPAGGCGSTCEGFDGGYASCCCHCRSPLCCQCQHVGGGGTPLEPAPRWDGPLRLASTRRPGGECAVRTRSLPGRSGVCASRAGDHPGGYCYLWGGARGGVGGGGGQDWRPLAITARGVWPARARAVARQATCRPARLVCRSHCHTAGLASNGGPPPHGGASAVAGGGAGGERVTDACGCGRARRFAPVPFLLQERRWLGLAVRSGGPTAVDAGVPHAACRSACRLGLGD